MRDLTAMRITIVAIAMLAARAAAPDSRQVDLRFDHTELIEWPAGETVQLSWERVEDSRCARGAVCVWEGEVTVDLGVAVNGMDARSIELTLPARGEKNPQAMVAGFAIRLIDVAPYPVLDVPTDRGDFVATLLVSSAEDNDASALRGQWKLESLEIHGESFAVLPGTELTLVIELSDAVGFARGTGGCNGYSASIEVGENGSVVFANMGFTEMACGQPAGVMEQEEQFFAALGGSSSFAADGSRLRLYGSARGARFLVFVRADDHSVATDSSWGRIKDRFRSGSSH
jgi:heat shock protein HslJ